ncbi:hypothetical protein L6452_43965 [Arctium lappa]|uniref:Uncharacterized protein n=1 Tax=Arctium lappa TaxID=4217 RepID=A0ACB8XEW6_ARCLA|nr:hypothetical protein L6452_43965 [Arctium lappa]
MGFHQCPQSIIPTSFSNQISLSGEVITLKDCKQQDTEIKEHALDKVNQILFEFLELEEAKHKGILWQRKIFLETHDLEKYFVQRLDDSQVKVISELLLSCQ